MKKIHATLAAFVRDEDGATMIAVIVAAGLVTLGTAVKTKYSSVSTCVATPTSTNCS
jgi:Flp pilus assembly pilin Flp